MAPQPSVWDEEGFNYDEQGWGDGPFGGEEVYTKTASVDAQYRKEGFDFNEAPMGIGPMGGVTIYTEE